MSKIKNSGLNQYGTGPFEQQQFGTADIEGVKPLRFVTFVGHPVEHDNIKPREQRFTRLYRELTGRLFASGAARYS